MTTLITTIGTGKRNEKSGEWEYQQAIYQYKDEKPVTTSYIGQAILKSQFDQDIDRLIVLGTRSSGWANLLSGFGLENDADCTELWTDLKLTEEASRKNSELPGITDSKRKRLQAVLAGKLGPLKIKLKFLPMAVNDAQLWNTLSIVQRIIADLPVDERIIIDVTHGLRHVQVFLASALGIVRQLPPTDRRKDIRFVYGALGQGRGGTSPILDLSMISKKHDWSMAVNSYLSHGDSEKLSGLIGQFDHEKAKNLAETVETLSFEVAGNYVYLEKDGSAGSLPKTLRVCLKQMEDFEGLLRQSTSPEERQAIMGILKILKDWIGSFISIKNPVDLLLALAKDHLKRGRYLLALTSCHEAVSLFQAITTNNAPYENNKEKIRTDFDVKLRNVPEKLRERFKKTCMREKSGGRSQNSLRTVRNQIVHCLPADDPRHVSAKGLKRKTVHFVEKTIEIIGELKKHLETRRATLRTPRN